MVETGMLVPLPFKISRAAEEHILTRLRNWMPSGIEPGLVRCFGYETRSQTGELAEKFNGVYFGICGDFPETWVSARSAIQTNIGELAVWISEDVVRVLRGKTLGVRPFDVGCGKHAGTIHDLLVAV